MGEFRAAKIKRDNSNKKKKSKRLGQHSFCDYLRRYYMAKEFEIEKSSSNGYMNILENHLIPYFDEKGILLSGISSNEINSYLLYNLNNGLSTSTVKKHKAVIGQAILSYPIAEKVINAVLSGGGATGGFTTDSLQLPGIGG